MLLCCFPHRTCLQVNLHYDSEVRRSIGTNGIAWLYALAYAALGPEKQSDTALKELVAKYSTRAASDIATVYAFRNQHNEAFERLDRAYAQREGNLAGANVDPLLQNLHSDPRFAAFSKKVNLSN